MPTANVTQNATAIAEQVQAPRIAKPPATMIDERERRATRDIGPHQKSSGSARLAAEHEEAERRDRCSTG